MLAERKEDYEHGAGGYEYDGPLYEEPPHLRQAPALRNHARLDTRLRSRCQVLFLVVSVLAMAVTVRSGISASRGYALVAIQQETQQLEQENERLRIEIAKLKSPQRIKEIAASELGMEVPRKMYFSHEKHLGNAD